MMKVKARPRCSVQVMKFKVLQGNSGKAVKVKILQGKVVKFKAFQGSESEARC